MYKKVLITGGAGFIGSRLVRAILADWQSNITILDNLSPQVHGENPNYNHLKDSERIRFIHGSVTDKSIMDEAFSGSDLLIHLAAETGTGQSMYEVENYSAVNVNGTATLLDWMANEPHSIKGIILASSRSVYGEGSYFCSNCALEQTPDARGHLDLKNGNFDLQCNKCKEKLSPIATKEDALKRPSSIYAATKLAQEHLVRVFGEAFDIPSTILRFQNVYGEGQSLKNPYTGILSIFSNLLMLNEPISVFEDGEETRDFVHVDDVVRAVMLSAEKLNLRWGTYNVGSGIAASVLEVSQLLRNALVSNSKLVITGEYRLGDIRHNFADLSAIARDLGFKPKITLEEGINSFASWVKQEGPAQSSLDGANAELASRKLFFKSEKNVQKS